MRKEESEVLTKACLSLAAAAGMNRAAAEEEYGVVSKLRKTSPTARPVNSEPWIQQGRAARYE
jgi:hypothetical protein